MKKWTILRILTKEIICILYYSVCITSPYYFSIRNKDSMGAYVDLCFKCMWKGNKTLQFSARLVFILGLNLYKWVLIKNRYSYELKNWFQLWFLKVFSISYCYYLISLWKFESFSPKKFHQVTEYLYCIKRIRIYLVYYRDHDMRFVLFWYLSGGHRRTLITLLCKPWTTETPVRY